MAEDSGHVITLFLNYLCKCFMISNLEARGVEPLFYLEVQVHVRPSQSYFGGEDVFIQMGGSGCY